MCTAMPTESELELISVSTRAGRTQIRGAQGVGGMKSFKLLSNLFKSFGSGSHKTEESSTTLPRPRRANHRYIAPPITEAHLCLNPFPVLCTVAGHRKCVRFQPEKHGRMSTLKPAPSPFGLVSDGYKKKKGKPRTRTYSNHLLAQRRRAQRSNKRFTNAFISAVRCAAEGGDRC